MKKLIGQLVPGKIRIVIFICELIQLLAMFYFMLREIYFKLPYDQDMHFKWSLTIGYSVICSLLVSYSVKSTKHYFYTAPLYVFFLGVLFSLCYALLIIPSDVLILLFAICIIFYFIVSVVSVKYLTFKGRCVVGILNFVFIVTMNLHYIVNPFGIHRLIFFQQKQLEVDFKIFNSLDNICFEKNASYGVYFLNEKKSFIAIIFQDKDSCYSEVYFFDPKSSRNRLYKVRQKVELNDSINLKAEIENFFIKVNVNNLRNISGLDGNSMLIVNCSNGSSSKYFLWEPFSRMGTESELNERNKALNLALDVVNQTGLYVSLPYLNSRIQ